jgi:hypothetical protein
MSTLRATGGTPRPVSMGPVLGTAAGAGVSFSGGVVETGDGTGGVGTVRSGSEGRSLHSSTFRLILRRFWSLNTDVYANQVGGHVSYSINGL